jgi:hypothetical protein
MAPRDSVCTTAILSRIEISRDDSRGGEPRFDTHDAAFVPARGLTPIGALPILAFFFLVRRRASAHDRIAPR